MATTDTTTPSKVARAIFEALSKKDLDAATEFITDDTVDDFVAIGEVRGKPAIRRFFDELLAAFPDFEMTVDRIVGDRSSAVVQWHAAGSCAELRALQRSVLPRGSASALPESSSECLR